MPNNYLNLSNRLYDWLSDIKSATFPAATVQPTDRQPIPPSGQTIRVSGHRSDPNFDCSDDLTSADDTRNIETNADAILQVLTFIGSGKDHAEADLIAKREENTLLAWTIIKAIEKESGLKGAAASARFCDVSAVKIYDDFANVSTNLWASIFIELKINKEK